MGSIKPIILGSLQRLVKGYDKKLPLIAGHKLLYSCNLRCKMCPFWRKKDERLLTLDEEVKMMETLRSAGILFIGFEGGEPLLRRDIEEILMEASRRFHTSLVTNGWLLKEKIDVIKDYLDHLFVSIDGIGEVHDNIRGVKGSFERALEGIKEAKRKNVPTSISFTLTRENLNEVFSVVELAKKLGVSVNIDITYDYSTAEKMSPQREELKDVLESLLKLKEKEEYRRIIINSKDYFIAILNSWYYNLPWVCKPWLTINIDPQGKIVLPCYTLSEYSGGKKIWEVNVVKLWNEFPWDEYSSCNKCALTCYLEPSLFNWKSLSHIKERIIEPTINTILRYAGEGI